MIITIEVRRYIDNTFGNAQKKSSMLYSVYYIVAYKQLQILAASPIFKYIQYNVTGSFITNML